jgi:hypothetical protein
MIKTANPETKDLPEIEDPQDPQDRLDRQDHREPRVKPDDLFQRPAMMPI